AGADEARSRALELRVDVASRGQPRCDEHQAGAFRARGTHHRRVRSRLAEVEALRRRRTAVAGGTSAEDRLHVGRKADVRVGTVVRALATIRTVPASGTVDAVLADDLELAPGEAHDARR